MLSLPLSPNSQLSFSLSLPPFSSTLILSLTSELVLNEMSLQVLLLPHNLVSLRTDEARSTDDQCRNDEVNLSSAKKAMPSGYQGSFLCNALQGGR